MKLEVYTDGGFSFKKQQGSYGFIITDIDHILEICEYGLVNHHKQTSQVAELMAMKKSIEYAHERICTGEDYKTSKMELDIYSDSKYCVNTMNEWLEQWARDKFTDDKSNLDLWKPLYSLKKKFKKINCIWVKGHSDNIMNNRVDELTQIALREHGIR